MRAQRTADRERFAGGLSAVVLATWISPIFAQSNSQMMRLPEPAPREISPELRYRSASSTSVANQKLIAAQNAKRWQLVLWASDELVVLSERAEKAAQAPPGAESKKVLITNTTKIESLAKNLTAALKAH